MEGVTLHINHRRAKLLACQVMVGGYEVDMANQFAFRLYKRVRDLHGLDGNLEVNVEVERFELDMLTMHQEKVLERMRLHPSSWDKTDVQECEKFLDDLRRGHSELEVN
jgi:hypothetical protein